ncbi:MAG: efflux transporter periplasmic adaptor subunit [Herminiimonas sp.]|nr:efflux transporter periplasmic adaptor subunit [Herminiimonas sp.]
MRVTSKQFLIAAILLAAGAGIYFALNSKSDTSARQPRNPVQVIRSGVAQQKSIPITVYANGTVTAFNTVDVRPQVQNIVRAVHVNEGQEVRAGQLLFTLDQRNDTSNVDKAQAQVARDRADLADAENTLKRNQELFAKKFVAEAVVDTARNKVDALRGTLKADQAAAQSSNVVLSYNQITASISGRIGAITVHPGSLAQPSSTPMVTISQIDPIAVAFAVPERELTYIVATYPKGDAPVVAQLAGGGQVEGKLVFIDNTSDTQTGTIRMKAEFPNKDRKMWPGTFVNVSLVSRTLSNAVVVPAQAVVTGPVEKSVYVVQPDETVKMQKIEVVTIDNGQAAVSGIAAGTRVVIEGTQNLRPGAKVKEMQATPAATGKNGKGGKKSAPQ